MIHRIFLLLGSNIGDRNKNIEQARLQISRHIGEIITTSSLYKTEPWGITQQPEFLNQVVEVDSPQSATQILEKIHSLEKDMGRVRAEKWGNRVIDIDILFFDNSIIELNELTIPHPEIANRRFTLVPLAEIAPDFIHPCLSKNMTQLLDECSDLLAVEKFID